MAIIFPETIIRDPSKSINWISTTDPVVCRRLSFPLYSSEKDSPMFTDIVQGDIGSCWFLSALISYLRPLSKTLEKSKEDIKNSIFLFKETLDRRIFKVQLSGKVFYIDDFVPLSYYREKIGDAASAMSCLWFILLEKAMLSLMTIDSVSKNNDESSQNIYLKEHNMKLLFPTYWVKNIIIRCGEMKAATIGIGQMVGGRNKYYVLHKQDVSESTPHIDSITIYTKFKGGAHILANTSRQTYPGAKYPDILPVSSVGAVPTHCYAVVGIEYSKEKKTYFLTMYNPWGKKEIPDINNAYIYPPDTSGGKGLSIISWEKFWQCFACVHISEQTRR